MKSKEEKNAFLVQTISYRLQFAIHPVGKLAKTARFLLKLNCLNTIAYYN